MPKRKINESDIEQSQPKKKQRYSQIFKAEYSERRPCFVPTGLAPSFASDFRVVAHHHGGLFDVKRHLASTKHAQMVDIKNSQQTFSFNVPSENEGLTAAVRAVINAYPLLMLVSHIDYNRNSH